MRKDKKKPSKSEIKYPYRKEKVLNKYINIQNENIIPLIDNLLNKIKSDQLKTTTMKIFLLFKKNNYDTIFFESIIQQFLKDYQSDPSSFLSYNQTPFTSEEKLIKSLNKSLTNCSFSLFKENNIVHVKLNPQNALEYIKNIYNKNYKDESPKSSEVNKKSKMKKKNNNSDNDKKAINNDEDNYLGKKRIRINKRKLSNYSVKNPENEAEEEVSKDENMKNNDSVNSDDKENTNKKGCDEGIKSLQKINMNNSVYFQGMPLKKNLSSLTFFDPTLENVKNFSSYNSQNYNDTVNNIINTDSIKINYDYNSEILYRSKNEEEMYNLLKKEIVPISCKIGQINEILKDKQEKCLYIEEHLKQMDENLNNYKTLKNIFKMNINNIIKFFKIIDIEVKTLYLLLKTESVFPFKDEEFSRHLEYFKMCLKEVKILIDNNDGKIIKNLNEFDINFNYCRKSIQDGVKDIIDNNYNMIPMQNIEDLIKPELLKYFQKIPNESNNNKYKNDFQILYNENNKYLKLYQKYMEKYEYFELNNMEIDLV